MNLLNFGQITDCQYSAMQWCRSHESNTCGSCPVHSAAHGIQLSHYRAAYQYKGLEVIPKAYFYQRGSTESPGDHYARNQKKPAFRPG